MLKIAITSHLRDLRAALGGGLKSERWAASIESDGGLKLEYPDGTDARIPPDRQLSVW
jgi:hypothetical protein